MRVAVIGAGISGLGAALALAHAHDVTVFEALPRLGGHANTLTIDYDGAEIAVDTGFIVYNTQNYPNLTAFFDYLGIATIGSHMSFGFSDGGQLEWSTNGLAGLFAWKRNALRPEFLQLLQDIYRFTRRARSDLDAERIGDVSIGDYVARLNVGKLFLPAYLLPMGAAIWSTPEADVLKYPAATFLRFFDNHRLLLQGDAPTWRTVQGGSQRYVAKAAALLEGRIRAGDPVVQVRRAAAGVAVRLASGAEHTFDHAILACHSDEALTLLGSGASAAERRLLGAVRYAPNKAYLHRDPGLMPKRAAVWGSWNYMRTGDSSSVCVSYWMNHLQSLDRTRPLFVTLNPPVPPREAMVFAEIDYAHPQFDVPAIQAQRAMHEIQGVDRISFAGAWLGYGFHEDGLSSGLAAARALGGEAPWLRAPALKAAA